MGMINPWDAKCKLEDNPLADCIYPDLLGSALDIKESLVII